MHGRRTSTSWATASACTAIGRMAIGILCPRENPKTSHLRKAAVTGIDSPAAFRVLTRTEYRKGSTKDDGISRIHRGAGTIAPAPTSLRRWRNVPHGQPKTTATGQ